VPKKKIDGVRVTGVKRVSDALDEVF
jgi:hypothetical protein